MNLYAYRERFFDYQHVGSLASARANVSLLLARVKRCSVLDMDCGAGARARAWLDAVTHVSRAVLVSDIAPWTCRMRHRQLLLQRLAGAHP